MEKSLGMNVPKVLGALLIGGYLFYCGLHSTSWHLVDAFDLIIHEAGHTLCFFCGQFIYILGGSLAQIVIPLVFVGYFYGRNDYYSASILFSWLGYNLLNLSVYVDDAVDMQLPLLGGDSAIHDWNFLLNDMGWLQHTHQIAALMNGIGFTILVVSILTALYYSQSKNESN